jgi:threonine dehydrogenase-like Zn-dependent dehydrogenase
MAFAHTPEADWKGMTIAVIGCGPVALCAIIAAREYKPARIFAIDSIPSRLETAQSLGCIPLNFKEVDVVAKIKEATQRNGVHAVIEGVGLSPALRTAYEIICPGGKISSFGTATNHFVSCRNKLANAFGIRCT